MANFHAQDGENPRKGCSTTPEELQEYRVWALRVVNDNHNMLFHKNVKHPWSDNILSQAKVQVVELEGDHIKDPRQFANAKDMIEYWENTPKNGTEAMTNRRVFLMEGMEPGVVELLGVKLGIPPQFFLAHCDHFADIRVIDDSFAPQNNSTYWKVPVKQQRKVPSGVPHGRYYLETGNCFRRETTIREGTTYVTAESFVSYWGTSYGRNSWTALILVDPHEMCLRSIAEPSDPVHKLEELYFHREVLVEVMALSKASGHKTTQPSQRDMFESAVEAYFSQGTLHTKDPFTGTMVIRNLILSVWESSVTRGAANIRDQFLSDRQEYQARVESIANFDSSDDGMQPNKAYFGLMVQRQHIQEDKDSIASVMRRFRCWDADDVPQEHLRQEVASQKSSTSETHSQHSEAFTGKRARLQELLREEKRSWKMIYETVCKMESDVAKHMEMWSQRAALEQASAANRSARTSGQLTKIATIIVPCTFVGSIFSMGGRFAAGEDLFFVYWAISIPATIMLLVWVLHHDIHISFEAIRKKYSASKNLRAAHKIE